jgi:hypothetical protein
LKLVDFCIGGKSRKEGLCRGRDDFLHHDEPPKLEAKPIEVGDGTTHPGPLERIKAYVRQDWPIWLYSSAEPSSGECGSLRAQLKVAMLGFKEKIT